MLQNSNSLWFRNFEKGCRKWIIKWYYWFSCWNWFVTRWRKWIFKW